MAGDENTALEENLTFSAIEFAVAVILVPLILGFGRNIMNKIHR